MQQHTDNISSALLSHALREEMQHLGNREIKIRPQHNIPPCQSKEKLGGEKNNNIIVLGGLVLPLVWDDIQSNVRHNGMACSEIMRGQIGDFQINDHISIIMQHSGLLVTPARAIIHHSMESYLHHLMCINVLNREIVNFSIRMTCIQTLWKT